VRLFFWRHGKGESRCYEQHDNSSKCCRIARLVVHIVTEDYSLITPEQEISHPGVSCVDSLAYLINSLFYHGQAPQSWLLLGRAVFLEWVRSSFTGYSYYINRQQVDADPYNKVHPIEDEPKVTAILTAKPADNSKQPCTLTNNKTRREARGGHRQTPATKLKRVPPSAPPSQTAFLTVTGTINLQ
jgi:hypothetical protein